jgi:uncharacterized caspase-like protein
VAPDRAAVIKGLQWLQEGFETGDVSLLFLAGLGTSDKAGQFFFLTAESDPDDKDLNDTAISRDRILSTIKPRKGSMVIMFDACRSGSSAVDLNRLANELNDLKQGAIVYASSTAKNPSFERADWQNGAFTKALIEGLSGKADPFDTGFVSTLQLAEYVRVRVEQLTTKTQTPFFLPDAAPVMTLAKLKP